MESLVVILLTAAPLTFLIALSVLLLRLVRCVEGAGLDLRHYLASQIERNQHIIRLESELHSWNREAHRQADKQPTVPDEFPTPRDHKDSVRKQLEEVRRGLDEQYEAGVMPKETYSYLSGQVETSLDRLEG